MADTVAAAIRAATLAIGESDPIARLDAELLMAGALGVSRSDLLLRHMRDAPPPSFSNLLQRRLADEPVAYILGSAEFYGLKLDVTPDVLIPRGDTEVLIDRARDAFADKAPQRVLDCGTGSGALLLAALAQWPEAQGTGIDRSAAALEVAARNAQSLDIAKRTTWHVADWDAPGWDDALDAPFDLILANPPYVEDDAPLAALVRDHEPAGALFAGPEGLDAYRALIPQLPALLAPDGRGFLEIGSRQADAVSAICAAGGFATQVHRDLAMRHRVVEIWVNC
ncbi:peptide chain release factor N(5)-glutamine methyltransferase [Novosphingobium aquimarinum]|uniref:peptide chain release factor N(5)-glutamine methyltransferase n=1 Tax=Novosphingobium aquimarinum TaxID=2682494 RepID=UPI0012EB1AEA|nr:peptide chain release factor N(5)-glutamine methyltransferase [Novosphingobium aquimarinum]